MPGTSPGVRSASAHSGGGVYVASVSRAQPANYVPSSGFRSLSTACSSTRLPPPFGEGNARAVLPTGFSPLEQAQELSLPGFPFLAFLPRLGLSLPRTERIGGAASVSLGQLTDVAFFRLQGLAPFESPLRASTPFKFAHRPIPSWASSSLRFPHQCGRRIFTPSARVLPPLLASTTFPLRGPPPLRAPAAPQRIWPPRQRPSLARLGYPSEVSRLPILIRVG
jgi:hypothetical protein